MQCPYLQSPKSVSLLRVLLGSRRWIPDFWQLHLNICLDQSQYNPKWNFWPTALWPFSSFPNFMWPQRDFYLDSVCETTHGLSITLLEISVPTTFKKLFRTGDFCPSQLQPWAAKLPSLYPWLPHASFCPSYSQSSAVTLDWVCIRLHPSLI